VPTLNVHLDIWDCVKSYVIHMFLARGLKITFTSNLKLIISFLVLHILLSSSLQVIIYCCLAAACSSYCVLSLGWPMSLVHRINHTPMSSPHMGNKHNIYKRRMTPPPLIRWGRNSSRRYVEYFCSLCGRSAVDCLSSLASQKANPIVETMELCK
jgi:hypothetical protein